MISSEKTVRVKNSNIDTVLLVKKLYDLRKEFVAGYSGKLRIRKYEQTRDFTIALNKAIFIANQKLADKSNYLSEIVDLEKHLLDLHKTFEVLKN